MSYLWSWKNERGCDSSCWKAPTGGQKWRPSHSGVGNGGMRSCWVPSLCAASSCLVPSTEVAVDRRRVHCDGQDVTGSAGPSPSTSWVPPPREGIWASSHTMNTSRACGCRLANSADEMQIMMNFDDDHLETKHSISSAASCSLKLQYQVQCLALWLQHKDGPSTNESENNVEHKLLQCSVQQN